MSIRGSLRAQPAGPSRACLAPARMTPAPAGSASGCLVRDDPAVLPLGPFRRTAAATAPAARRRRRRQGERGDADPGILGRASFRPGLRPLQCTRKLASSMDGSLWCIHGQLHRRAAARGAPNTDSEEPTVSECPRLRVTQARTRPPSTTVPLISGWQVEPARALRLGPRTCPDRWDPIVVAPPQAPPP